MDRFNWYRIIFEYDFRKLASNIQQSTFDDDVGQGFSLHAISLNSISGRFIRAKIIKEEYTNPFGDSDVVERKVYEFFDFVIFNGHSILVQIKNQTRSINDFFNELNRCCGYTLIVDTPKLDLFKLIQRFRERNVRIIKVKEIDLVDISLSSFAIGSLNIKGNVSIEKYCEEIPMAKLKHTLKRFKALIDFDGIQDVVEVYSSNKIVVNERFSVFFIPLITDCIYELYI